jgi:hypothetical protein
MAITINDGYTDQGRGIQNRISINPLAIGGILRKFQK